MITLKSDTFLQGGKYKIVRFISAGGFGCTYEGVHVLLRKRVAIKEFFVKDFCNRDEATAAVTIGTTSKTALVKKLKTKFIEEAQFVSTLKHQHVVNVYDVFEENGTAYYVMDYVDGPSLNDILKRDGAMNEKKAQKYILQVADALKYVHSQNRLHLDVKPGNIMIDKDDNAILIDFGTSKQYDEEAGENTSTLMGKTPGFAPLEQMGNDVVKFYPSTDIYSLGATFYKLLTGITPPSATLLASGEELKPLPSSISENVRNAVNKAMQTNKNTRPQSIDEFVKILSAPVEEDNTIYENDGKGNKVDDEPTEVTIGKSDDKKTKLSKTKIGIIVGVCCIVLVAALGMLRIIDIFPDSWFGNGGSAPDPVIIENDSTKVNNLAQVEEALRQRKEYVTGQTFKDAAGKEFTYSGEVANGKPNGQGMGVYSYGTYVGTYQNGLRHGDGKFESKDGSNKYEGSFANDKYDTGKLILTDGSYYNGTFSKGQPYSGTWYNKDGSVDSNIVEGK